MRITHLASAVLGLAVALIAQPPPIDGIQIFPGRSNDGATFIARLGYFATAATTKVECLAEYPTAFFEGLGDVSTVGGVSNLKCQVSNVVVYFQDEDRTTSERFDLIMRPAKATGTGPDLAATPIFQFVNIAGPTATGSGRIGWGLTVTFLDPTKPNPPGTPLPITIPCNKSLYFGMVLNPNLKWPGSPATGTDGLSVYVAYYDVSSFPNPKPRFHEPFPAGTKVVSLSWRVTGTGTNRVAVNSATGFPAMTIAYSIASPGPMLQLGAVVATSTQQSQSKNSFGAAALYPTVAATNPTRTDGVAIRITDNQHPGPGPAPGKAGSYILLIALNSGSQFKIPPIHIGGLTGNLYLGPARFVLLVGALARSGAGSTAPDTIGAIVPINLIPASAKGLKIHFQAATSDTNGSNGAISNMATMQF